MVVKTLGKVLLVVVVRKTLLDRAGLAGTAMTAPRDRDEAKAYIVEI